MAWGQPRAVEKGAVQVKSDLSPAVVGYASRLYCIWSDQATSHLSFLVLDDTGAAGELQQDNDDPRILINGKPEVVRTTPAVAALEGIIHVVYPDEFGNLIHIQFDDTKKTWGCRCGLAVNGGEGPALAVFGGQLICGCSSPDGRNFTILRWTSEAGWSQREATQGLPPMKGRRSMFELNARLGIVAVKDEANSNGFYYEYEQSTQTWSPSNAQGVGVSAPWGVHASCVNDLCFVAYATSAKVAIKQYDVQRLKDVNLEAATTMVTPVVAILDNRVYCFWVDNAKSMQYSSRRALVMPQLNAWMSAISGNAFLSSLTIPGIHDAAAAKIYIAIKDRSSWVPFACCQSLPISRLLAAGVRYIDLRAGYLENDLKTLIAYHNFVPMADADGNPLTIESIFQDCYKFLAKSQSKSEGLLMQIKQDYEGKDGAASKAKFATDMKALINKSSNKWLLSASVPQLGDLRGKIQLIRRFPAPDVQGDFGIDVSDKATKGDTWRDNTTFELKTGNVTLQIQDLWNLDLMNLSTMPQTKFESVKQHLGAGYKDKALTTWYINFTSANKPGGLTGPLAIANGWWLPYPVQGVNSKLDAYFNAAKSKLGRYGTILMDYPQDTPELLNAIVRMNIGAFAT